jgi:hypothetical protein
MAAQHSKAKRTAPDCLPLAPWVQVMENCHNPKWGERFSLLVHYPETQVGGQRGGQAFGWVGKCAGRHVVVRMGEALAVALLQGRENGSAGVPRGRHQQLHCSVLFCGGALKRRYIARPPPPQVLVAKLFDYDAFDRDDEIGRWGCLHAAAGKFCSCTAVCSAGAVRCAGGHARAPRCLFCHLLPYLPPHCCRVEIPVRDLPCDRDLDDWFVVEPPHQEKPASQKFQQSVGLWAAQAAVEPAGYSIACKSS